MAVTSREIAQQLPHPKIGSQGVHRQPFDSTFPIDLTHLAFTAQNSVPTNRDRLLRFEPTGYRRLAETGKRKS